MDTTFALGTLIQPDWLNDVNDHVYNLEINVKLPPFNAVGDGVADDTVALKAALATGLPVLIPEGKYKYTETLTLPAYVTVRGEGFGLFANTAKTILLKSFTGPGVVVSGACVFRDISVEGTITDASDGVHLLGGRAVLQNVSSFNHGRDGFKIGDYSVSTQNTNIWRAYNLIARGNARHGVHVAHEGETTNTDANAGILVSLEASYNGGDGLRVGEAYDNTFLGIVSQSNTGYGIKFTNYARGNSVITPYTENNTAGDMSLDAGANRNYVFGFRAGQNNDGYTDAGTANLIIGRYASYIDAPLHKNLEAFTSLALVEQTTSGIWTFTKDPTTRNASLTLSGTSASGDLFIQNTGGGAAGVRFSTATNTGALRNILRRNAVSINFGSVPAQSTVDSTVTVSGADGSYTYFISAIHALAAGVTVSVYWDGTNVKARCANSTTSAVSVSGQFNLVGMQIG